MINFFRKVIYIPLYNLFVFLISLIPGHNVGLSIILLTFLIRTALFPLSQKASRSQLEMKLVEPEIKKIKEEFKNNQTEQAKKIMEVYKKHQINPFSGCLVVLVQIPIIISLYYALLHGLKENFSDNSLLYSFIKIPSEINFHFLGINVSQKSLIISLLAGVSQFFQAFLINTFKPKEIKEENQTIKKPNFQESFTQNLNFQMQYVFPLLIVFIAYQLPSGLALYWTVSNIFTIIQEWIIRLKLKKKHEH